MTCPLDPLLPGPLDPVERKLNTLVQGLAQQDYDALLVTYELAALQWHAAWPGARPAPENRDVP